MTTLRHFRTLPTIILLTFGAWVVIASAFVVGVAVVGLVAS